MKRAFTYANYLLLIVSVLTAGSAFLYLILLAAFGQRTSRVIYWLAFTSNRDDLVFTAITSIFLVVASAFVILTITSRLTRPRAEPLVYFHWGAKAVGLLMVTGLLLYVGVTLIELPQSETGWEPVADVSVKDHTYHLLLYSLDWARGDGEYDIYDCDRIQLVCDKLPISPSIQGDTNNLSKAHLLANSTTNTVALAINGVVAYTYHIQ